MTRSTNFFSATNSSSTRPPPPESEAVESDFVVILAALLCTLISVVGLITVARCTWLRGGRYPMRPSANKGLKKKVLQSLPMFTYDSSSLCGAAAGECAICLGEYADRDEIRVLPHCNHGFHVQCIDTWLRSHSSCPSCRQILAAARCRSCGEITESSAGEIE